MDIFSHALYANLVFSKLPIEQRALATILSVAPDLCSFSLVSASFFFKRLVNKKKFSLDEIPKYVDDLYNITHSLVIWLGIFLVLILFNLKWLAVVYLGWALHIIIDIFTHTDEFFPTPIFWPISRLHFSGIKWASKWFIVGNYSFIIILYLLYFFK